MADNRKTIRYVILIILHFNFCDKSDTCRLSQIVEQNV